MMEALRQPWPWYIAGPLIGLMVPALLILGNKNLGISSSLRHVCAACVPAKIPFFRYNWKQESWNLLFVLGILLGGAVVSLLLSNPDPVAVHPALAAELQQYGITEHGKLLPEQIFSWEALGSLRGWIFMVLGGFLVGFGTRYAGGCTSGHSIMGLSNLQWPSLVATISFMLGGFIMANAIFPLIMN